MEAWNHDRAADFFARLHEAEDVDGVIGSALDFGPGDLPKVRAASYAITQMGAVNFWPGDLDLLEGLDEVLMEIEKELLAVKLIASDSTSAHPDSWLSDDPEAY